MKCFIALLAVCAVFASLSLAAQEESVHLREAAGSELTTARCAMCHSLDYVQMNAEVLDRAGWEKTVRKMIDRFGAPIAADEAQQIVDYLGENY